MLPMAPGFSGPTVLGMGFAVLWTDVDAMAPAPGAAATLNLRLEASASLNLAADGAALINLKEDADTTISTE